MGRRPAADLGRVLGFEPSAAAYCAVTPVEAQVEREVRRDVLPAAVGHEAGGGELAHVGVDERHAEAALLPSLQQLRVAAPGLV